MGGQLAERFQPLARLRQAGQARADAGLRRTLAARDIDSALIDLASNDYLGLAGDPRITAGSIAAASTWGTGSTGSRLVTGTTKLHLELENALAEFTGAQESLVFSSGYLANLTVITALAAALGPELLVVSDARNHASIIDGCRLSRARVAITPHRDAEAVDQALATRTEAAALVVSDAVFSVEGTLGPVAELHAAARRHGALLILDEAHSFGVLGPNGRGAAAAAGIEGEPDLIRTLTLSKSLAGQGGAVLGSADVIGTLIDTGRGFIFDTGLAPPIAGAALAALDIVRSDPRLGQQARAHANRLAGLAASLGFRVIQPDAAVLAVTLGDPWAAVRAQQLCAQQGVRVGCFRPPSVPPGQACLRITCRANLTERDFDLVTRALTAVRDDGRS